MSDCILNENIIIINRRLCVDDSDSFLLQVRRYTNFATF